MLTKEQILEYLRENPDYTLPEEATEEEEEAYRMALEELGVAGGEDWDDEDLEEDEDDEDWDDEDWDDDWEEEEL